MRTGTAKSTFADGIAQKGARLVRRAVRDLLVSLRYLPMRRKVMLASILLIGASYYSAPAGILLLAGYTGYEWIRAAGSGDFRMPFGTFARRSVFFIPGLILALSAFIGALAHAHFFSALIALFVLAPILFTATAIQFLWKKEDALHFARYSVMLILPVFFLSALTPWTGSLFAETGKSIRLMGTFANPNFFAYILEMFLVFCLALFYHIWEKRTRTAVILSFAAGIVCLVLTGSRTGLIAFLVGLTVFLFAMSEKGILSAVFALTAIVLALAAIFPEKAVEILGHIIPRSAFDTRGFENRFQLWGIAIRQIKKNPFVGTGLFTYNLYVPVNAPEPIRGAVHAHNIFLNFWLETGLPGVLSMIWILARTAVLTLRRLHGSPMRPYLAAGLGLIVLTTVHGIMDAPLVSAQTIAFFGIFTGTLYAGPDEARTGRDCDITGTTA